ncbi:MAG: tetratricopeptide repeat protein [Terriglobales bacterium]
MPRTRRPDRRRSRTTRSTTSLGEAYMKNGQKALAIENYEKSLRLNPENRGGEAALAQLRAAK